MLPGALALLLGAVVSMQASTAASAASVRFGTPPWPGATVKAEVAAQLLNAMGYTTQTSELGTEAVILNALASDDLDVYMALWYPLSAGQLDPLVDEGKVVKLAENLQGAVLGLAVPRYVHEGGVSSVDDLAQHAGRFGRRVYGIEAGNYWNEQAKAAIKAGKYGLGDWELVPSSTSAMLTQVDRAVEENEWILFYGWRPHWMNVPYDLYYLDAPEESNIADVQSTVFTIARAGFAEEHPEIGRFLGQLRVELAAQDKWILEHGKNDRPENEVAREWIRANLNVVKGWVEDVETADGESAWQAIRAEFGS
jgi:glycine betaine/proline transport system substrate-binding protein